MSMMLRWLATAGTAVVRSFSGLWHAVATLADNLSDAGHGPNPPREEAGRDDAYAGAGPVEPLRDDEDRPKLE